MKHLVIFLILAGFIAVIYADEPPQFPGKLDPSPYDLWNSNEIILDGIIVQKETKDNIAHFDIQINELFKGNTKASLVSGFMKNEDSWIFEEGDHALIYISKEKEISIYSTKVFPNCSAREHIQISPILPNDDTFVRGAPTLPWDWHDPCLANYFTYDPDFWNYMEYKPPLRQYYDHYLPTHMQRCDGENVPVSPVSHPNRIGCVKPSTGDKLVKRGWATIHSCVNTWDVQPGKDSLTCFCSEGEFRKLGGYYAPEESPLELGMIQPIFRDGQHGVEVVLNNPTETPQYAYVYVDCEGK